MNRALFALSAALIGFSSSAYGQGQPVIPLVNGAAVSTANPMPITGTFSATIAGFPTTQTTGTPISVTTGGVTGTLPAGTEVVATNVGTTNAAYCKLGASATTSDQYIAPNGGWFGFTVGAATQLTCITSTSTTTVNMVGGSGIPTGTGGGSGGSGGSVTQGTSPWVVAGNGTAGTAATGVLSVQGIASMTPILATLSGTNNIATVTSLTQFNGVAIALNAGAASTGTLRTVTASDSPEVTVLGALSASPGCTTQSIIACLYQMDVDIKAGSGSTGSAVPAAALYLGVNVGGNLVGMAPGTAGTAGSQVWSVQGIASMTPILANPGTAANWGVVATGAAPPANTVYVGGLGSGATGGLARANIICDLHAFYTGSDNGSKTLVAGVSGRKTYICSWLLTTGTTATTLTLYKGTDADCATSGAAIGPPYALLANDRVGISSPTWNGFVTATNADYVCVNAGAGNAHTAEIWYAIL